MGQELSTPYEATSGVPQGSHLGPILFLLYMQDLVARLLVDHSLYADDLKISQKTLGCFEFVASEPNEVSGYYFQSSPLGKHCGHVLNAWHESANQSFLGKGSGSVKDLGV